MSISQVLAEAPMNTSVPCSHYSTQPHFEHFLQVYESDDFLASRIADFVTDGLKSGERVFVIATAAHRTQLLTELTARGIDSEQVTAKHLLALFDAEQVLERFMVEGWP